MDNHYIIVFKRPKPAKKDLSIVIANTNFFMKIPDLCLNCIQRFGCIQKLEDCFFTPTKELRRNLSRVIPKEYIVESWEQRQLRSWKIKNRKYVIIGYVPRDNSDSIDVVQVDIWGKKLWNSLRKTPRNAKIESLEETLRTIGAIP